MAEPWLSVLASSRTPPQRGSATHPQAALWNRPSRTNPEPSSLPEPGRLRPLSEPPESIQLRPDSRGSAERKEDVSTYITAVRMSPSTANDHEHISEVRWEQPGKTDTCTRQAMINFIEKGNAVYVHGSPDAQVGVVRATPPYLRTYADGNWTNNLLSLPRF